MRSTKKRPDEAELRRLPDRKALIKGRLSSLAQVRESKQSLREIARLVEIAIGDGYRTGFDPTAVERWLEDIRLGLARPEVREDGDVILECLGLGISGSLPEDKRPDLAYDMDLLRNGVVGAIYVTEGANRLARDPDGVVSATLLKLMKETNCKLRTPEDILSPRIERDWEVIHDELEKGAEELKGMRRRLFRRKELKAERGDFVGEPIPPGFVLPILDRAPDGKYEFGKMKKYEPHAEVVNRILWEYVRQLGSRQKTALALAGVTFPAFKEPFRHMESYSSLRRCPKKMDGDRIVGYYITPSLIQGLVTNPKLIGIWHWGDVIKPNNHDVVAEVELFLTAYELAISHGKRKGRAIRHEPPDWAGLLWCCNHEEAEPVYTNSCHGSYICERGYNNGREPSICLHVAHRFIDEPLTTEVLRRLDFTPYAEEVLANLETEASLSKWEEAQRRRDEAALEQEIKRWKALLPSCVDLEDGRVDREREEYYWGQIREAEARLQALRARPVRQKKITAIDVQMVRQFLSGLSDNWHCYPGSVRNHLLKVLITRAELRHSRDRAIRASVIWKAGLVQEITIYLPPVRYTRDRRWTSEEDSLLRMLWQSSRDAIEAALPNRTWQGIVGRARTLELHRQRTLSRNGGGSRWQAEEDATAQQLYEAGVPLDEMVQRLGRGRDAIICRASQKGWQRPVEAKFPLSRVRWEADRLKVLEGSSSSMGC